MSKSYDELVAEQIAQYQDMANLHDLPASFHVWSGHFLGPGMEAVFGLGTITEFFVQAFLQAAAKSAGRPAFLSLGCGDGSVEIPIARALVTRGLTDFRFVCYDLSEPLLDRFRAAIPTDLVDRFELSARDLNGKAISETFDAVMANHSLHHMVDLEGIFAAVYANLADHGVFVTNDMIGRNGHMRWPETKLFVDLLWPFLTMKQRVNPLLSRVEAEFINHDCSTEGFEGVRAQDILPEILNSGFRPARFLSAGGLVDVFIERSFGPNFDLSKPDDALLIRRIALLSEILLDAGVTKPTLMLAYFVKQPVEPIFYRNRTALAAIRDTIIAPSWIAAALEDFGRLPVDPEFVFRSSEPSELIATQRSELVAAQLTLAEQARRITALEASTSWRITAPLRWLAARVRS